MQSSRACSRRVLATGETTLVEQCSCGHVHLTIGGVTLRLDPESLPPIADVLGDAARALHCRYAHVHEDALS
jgi:hypothetical protein